jgi:hypothetical protein
LVRVEAAGLDGEGASFLIRLALGLMGLWVLVILARSFNCRLASPNSSNGGQVTTEVVRLVT